MVTVAVRDWSAGDVGTTSGESVFGPKSSEWLAVEKRRDAVGENEMHEQTNGAQQGDAFDSWLNDRAFVTSVRCDECSATLVGEDVDQSLVRDLLGALKGIRGYALSRCEDIREISETTGYEEDAERLAVADAALAAVDAVLAKAEGR